MLNSKFDLIIFDCDGILVDSEPIADIMFRKALDSEGVYIPDDKFNVKITLQIFELGLQNGKNEIFFWNRNLILILNCFMSFQRFKFLANFIKLK